MKRKIHTVSIALALVSVLSLSSVSCYGPFNLTRQLHYANGEMEGEWAQEGVFVLMVFFPAYLFAAMGDMIVFNSIEFWSGENPIDVQGGDQATSVDSDDGREVVLKRTDPKDG